MAAYAAIVSFINLVEDIQNHPHISTIFDHKQLHSLREKLDFFLSFVESYNSGGCREEAEELEHRIASEVYAAENAIESQIVDLILSESNADGETSLQKKVEGVKFPIHDVIEVIDSVKKSIVGFRDSIGVKLPENSSTGPVTGSNTTTVGFRDESIQIIERLIQPEPNRQIIPIVGMGGTGKTTLARLVYDHSHITQHFDIRMRASISQRYRMENILSQLLSRKEKPTTETVNELGEELHKKLWGRRYLIMLDDMWSIEAWNEIQLFLPDDGNRGRVVVTTRLSNIAALLSSVPFQMNFLDEEKSWGLFCAKAFGEEDCPPELEEIGKDIVRKCKGLALSIVVIGGHLRKSSRMKGYWESVSNDINSVLDSGEDQCSSILSSSYNHLPAHLKPCFLYMGVFEEDEDIYVPHLISLWVAEGLLKHNNEKSREEIAEDYLKDLVDRNLILVHRWDDIGKYAVCKIHDLLRELSIKVAKKEDFFCVLDTTKTIHREHRVVTHMISPKNDPIFLYAPRLKTLARYLECEGGELSSNFRLLRVGYDKVEVVVNGGLFDPNFLPVNLRYLTCEFFELPPNFPEHKLLILHLPPSISLIWNLQTIVIIGSYDKVVAPSEIWKMLQLRHLEVTCLRLPDPPQSQSNGVDRPILQNLHTLSQVGNLSLSEDVCKRIPNIKILKLFFHFERESDGASLYYFPQNFGSFHKLESLICRLYGKPSWYHFACHLKFPTSLQKLQLSNFPLHWDDLAVISLLPHLVALTLFRSVDGPEWNPIPLGFPCLKFLTIMGCGNLVSWNADSSHFPVLESLTLSHADELDEIPSCIGDIPTLQSINLYDCSDSAAISAARILVEQQELGNYGLRVKVTLPNEEMVARFNEMLQEEGLTYNNLYPKLILGAIF